MSALPLEGIFLIWKHSLYIFIPYIKTSMQQSELVFILAATIVARDGPEKKTHLSLFSSSSLKFGCSAVELPLSDVPFASSSTATLSGVPPGGWEGSKY